MNTMNVNTQNLNVTGPDNQVYLLLFLAFIGVYHIGAVLLEYIKIGVAMLYRLWTLAMLARKPNAPVTEIKVEDPESILTEKDLLVKAVEVKATAFEDAPPPM